MEKKWYPEIDILKGFATFLVVLGHSIIVFPINLHNNIICDFIFRWLSSVHMPLFFLISGFCFSYHNNYKKYIEKKIKRIAIPYFIFNIIDTVPRLIFPNLVNHTSGIGEYAKSWLLYGGEYWFLYVLFIILMIYPLINKVLRNNTILQVLFVGIIFLLQFIVTNISLFGISTVIYYLFYFSIGAILKERLGNQDSIIINNRNKIVGIIVGSIIWVALVYFDFAELRTVTALIGIMSIFLCAYNRKTSFFSKFAKYSLQIYLLGAISLGISRTFIVSILGIQNPLIIISFNLFIDFFVSYWIIKYICEKISFLRIAMGMN